MAPSVTVLQLDTDFPRIAGDVGCADTYAGDMETLRIDGATVGEIVSEDPSMIQIAPFETALAKAKGDVVVTSCGFLSYWQTHLQQQTAKPFISSALTALPELCEIYAPQDILTITFDATRLNHHHFGRFQTDVVGLHPDMHLRQVISQNLATLDVALASQEIVALVSQNRAPRHKHILLECTNLPPYKHVLAASAGLPITDVLSCIEEAQAGTIHPQFLSGRG